jgi:hypothetical protein
MVGKYFGSPSVCSSQHPPLQQFVSESIGKSELKLCLAAPKIGWRFTMIEMSSERVNLDGNEP